jgi:hypothetical protein
MPLVTLSFEYRDDNRIVLRQWQHRAFVRPRELRPHRILCLYVTFVSIAEYDDTNMVFTGVTTNLSRGYH